MLMNTNQNCDAAFKRVVLLKCYDALVAEGFTRFRKEYVDWPLEHGFHCWVGLNTGSQDGFMQINPFVGIHVVQIERFWTDLNTGKYPGKYSRGHATYAVHMGELAPNESAFHFSPLHSNIDAEAARLARLYASVGLVYAKSIASYATLLPLLEKRVPMLGAYPERVAACLFLMDRKEEARSFASAFLEKHRDYFEGFAIPFLKLLAH